MNTTYVFVVQTAELAYLLNRVSRTLSLDRKRGGEQLENTTRMHVFQLSLNVGYIFKEWISLLALILKQTWRAKSLT